MPPQTLRACREALECSQSAFAAELGVFLETYRVWDSGRRSAPARILDRARALVAHQNDQELLPLRVLALLIGVHVRTLRNAARDGRLSVTYDTRTTYTGGRPDGNPVIQAPRTESRFPVYGVRKNETDSTAPGLGLGSDARTRDPYRAVPKSICHDFVLTG